ncbi:MAG: Asr1405/Asl0597 family protein [Cyanobacteria bacterium J06621_11]
MSLDSADNQGSIPLLASSMTVACDDRWQVYHRLQSLEIDCTCGGFRPLQVDIKTPTELLQLRSVVQHVSASRTDLVAQLNRCWHL